MPRHPRSKTTPLSTYEELRNLRLAVALRTEQVKLRRLEWDTQRIALPHITPLPGDGELQIRKPLTKDDLPVPNPPAKPPQLEAGDDREIYKLLMQIYVDGLVAEKRRDPYNWLASISAQKKRESRESIGY